MRTRLLGLLLVVGAATILVPAVSGQTSLGSISGLVSDQSGASVPDVTIDVTDIGRNTTFSTSSNDQGFYVVTQLPPGTYSLTAETAGFRRYELGAIIVSTQEKVSADIILELGAVTESVSVTANVLELKRARPL